jgi:hypothetical protein
MAKVYNVWAHDGHYIMGTLVLEGATKEEGLKAIAEAIAPLKKFQLPLKAVLYERVVNSYTGERHCPIGSYEVVDSTPGMVGPFNVGTLQLIVDDEDSLEKARDRFKARPVSANLKPASKPVPKPAPTPKSAPTPKPLPKPAPKPPPPAPARSKPSKPLGKKPVKPVRR